jgi:nitrogen fixation protein FixH
MEDGQPKISGFLKLGKHWPLLIVGMLVVHASIILGTIAIVSARHDLYVETDYYAKSIDWDTQREMLDAAENLGWAIQVAAGESDSDDSQVMRVSISDANGESIDGALVEIECFHPANATERINAVLIADGDGAYQKSLALNKPGYWQANLAIRYQGVHAMVRKEVEIQ